MLVKTAFVNAAILAVNFATGLLAARLLGPEGRGHYALLLLYPQLISYLALLGLDRSVPIVVGQRLTSRPRRLVLVSALATAAVATLATIICVRVTIEAPWLRRLAIVFCAYIPLYQVFTLFIAAHVGRGDFRSYNWGRGAFYISYLALLLMIVALGRQSVSTFALAYGVSSAIGGLAAFALFPARAPRSEEDATAPAEGARTPAEDTQVPAGGLGVRRLAAVTVPFALPGILYAFAATIDKLILSIWLDPRSLGVFVVYTSYVTLVGPVANAINATVFHRSLSRGTTTDLVRFVRLSSLVYAGMLILLGLVAHVLVHLLYGPSFTDDLGSVYILLASSFFLSTSQVLNEHLKGRRSTLPDIVSNAIYVTVVMAGAFLLVGRYHLAGLAFAVATGNLARYLTVAAFFHRQERVRLAAIMLPSQEDLRVAASLLANSWRQWRGSARAL